MTDTVRKTAPRWMNVLLVISLALNLLVIGAVVAKSFLPGHNLSGKGPHGALAHPAAMHKAGRHLLWKLPRQRRRELRQLVRMHRSNMQTELNDLANARLAFARLIGRNSVDEANLDSAWMAVRKAEAALHTKASALTRDFIQSLTPKEQNAYAAILQNPPRRRWQRRLHRD